MQIYYWGRSRATIVNRRKRRAIPSYAAFVNVAGGNTQRHIVNNLKPYTNYNMAIKAFNSGGEGPASMEVFVLTEDTGKPRPFSPNIFLATDFIEKNSSNP